MDATNLLNAASISGVHTSAGIPSRNARDLETSEGGVAFRDAGAYDCGALWTLVTVDVWVVMPDIFGS